MSMFQKFRDYMNEHPLRWLAWYLIVVLFGLCAAVATAIAADLTVTWTPPTQNTDGSAIPASGAGSVASARVEWGTCAGSSFGTAAGQQIVAAPAVTATVTGLAPATWCVRVFARNTYGAESAASNVASRTLAPPTPRPPTSVTATELIAYTVVKQRDRFVLLPIGTVPGDTPCDTTQSVNGHYVVPRAAVTWSGSVKPDVVVARCG